jgi:hypothetical protein
MMLRRSFLFGLASLLAPDVIRVEALPVSTPNAGQQSNGTQGQISVSQALERMCFTHDPTTGRINGMISMGVAA